MAASEIGDRASRARTDPAAVFLNRAIRVAYGTGALLGLAALAVLALRAVLRIETRWDAFWYHIPFAARRAGLGIPYEMSPFIQALYNGFPPLPEFLQGVLWRATGSLNATGTINILALGVFLYYCRRKLKAPFSVVAILSLTAPLVIIHAASNYIDLFGNAFLAIGVASLIAMVLFDRWTDRSLLCWGLAGLAIASWSKTLALPIAAACFLCYLGFYASRFRDQAFRRLLFIVAGAALLAAMPSVKNLILYGNPIWPVKMPVWSSRFPFIPELDPRLVHLDHTPAPLINLSQPDLFVHSVLEIGHPTEYPSRERWVIDQGNAWIAFRSGGFWNVAVVTALMAAVLAGFLLQTRKGWILLGVLAAMWCFVAIQPDSHDLRHFLFLPLTMAAVVGMLLPLIRPDYPAVTLVLLVLFPGEFAWMANVNRDYYKVERVNYEAAADFWHMSSWWPTLRRGETYCAAGFEPATIFLTGPTMKEFHIVERTDPNQCPPKANVLIGPNIGILRQ